MRNEALVPVFSAELSSYSVSFRSRLWGFRGNNPLDLSILSGESRHQPQSTIPNGLRNGPSTTSEGSKISQMKTRGLAQSKLPPDWAKVFAGRVKRIRMYEFECVRGSLIISSRLPESQLDVEGLLSFGRGSLIGRVPLTYYGQDEV